MREKSLLPTLDLTPTNRGLLNVFSGVTAIPQQTQDLLDCIIIGQEQSSSSNNLAPALCHFASTGFSPWRFLQQQAKRRRVRSRYQSLSNGYSCAAEAVVIDVLHTTPLQGRTILKYTQMVLNRHVISHYQDGVILCSIRAAKVGSTPNRANRIEGTKITTNNMTT